jgi:methionyl-tRNA formyltransferase
MKNSDIRIVFMGTPEFAVAPLQAIKSAGMDIAGVVTAPDKPAGRGKKLTSPAVKVYAEKALNCPVLQPEKLRDPEFIHQLSGMQADLFIVVAFRMLPEAVWTLPKHGTINLHASLLPQYRGAAPVNWCIINGEKETGLTTFLIDREIDTGKILLQEKMAVGQDENAGELHDRMMEAGAALLVRTIEQVMEGTVAPVPQEAFSIPGDQLKKAPKIFKPDCRIDWSRKSETIHNLVRGMSPFPGAFTYLAEAGGERSMLKVFATKRTGERFGQHVPGTLHADNANRLHVKTGDGWLELKSVQAEGKKRMSVPDFLRGFRGNINECTLQ